MGVAKRPWSADLSLFLWGAGIAGLLAVSWAATYLLDGTAHVPPHWFYVPVFLSARRFRVPVVLLTAVAAGLLAGPLVAADVDSHVAQQASDWITRAAFFIALGLFVHALFGRLERAYERERRDATRLRALDEERVRMLTAVSHEVRTPLTAIMGFGETLESAAPSLTSEEIATIAGRLNANAGRLLGLLGGILEVEASGRPGTSPNPERVDLAEVMQRVLARSNLSSRPQTLDLDPTMAEVDPAHVERVIDILLSNVIHHTEDGVPVWVRVGRDGDHAILEVSDAGRGVPEALRERVFEPFRQGPSLRPHSPGAGLGLAVARQLVEANGGRLTVADRPGGGARFVVILPLAAH